MLLIFLVLLLMGKSKGKERSAKGSSVAEETEGGLSRLAISGIVVATAVLLYQINLQFSAVRSNELPSDQLVPVPCSESSYIEEAKLFPRCIPRLRCGRFASDSFITSDESDQLLNFAERAMSLTRGGLGGVTIFDMNTGAVSFGEKFIPVWTIANAEKVLKPEDFEFFWTIESKVKTKISQLFGIPTEILYLTNPCFFSRLTSAPAKIPNDEYWHNHVDKVSYGKFIYTALIYLASHGTDFDGGRFVFVDNDKNVTITPKKGSFATFTSGDENPHLVERVTEGKRYALTVAYTCDPEAGIPLPKWRGAGTQ